MGEGIKERKELVKIRLEKQRMKKEKKFEEWKENM